MADEKLLQKKRQEFIQQRREELQQSEDFFTNYAQMDQLLEKEANEHYTQENLRQRIAAEKAAGLEKKRIPEQEIPAEVMKKIENEYADIHDGEEMGSKDRKNAKKEYKRKIKHTERAQKILDNYNSYKDSMSELVSKNAKKMSGKDGLGFDERQNVNTAIWMNTCTGGSAIAMTDTVLNLSISEEAATPEQAERKALEIEKMFNIFLNYDVNRLKYKNSEDFLKNAAERMMMGDFATEMDAHFASYRKLVSLGKLKRPLNPRLINEAEARVKLIQTSMTRSQAKLMVMSSEKFALTDKDSINQLDDEELSNKIQNLRIDMDDKKLPEEKRKNAKRDWAFYSGVRILQNIDSQTEETERFQKKDKPEALLAAHRKMVDANNPVPADYEEKLEGLFVKERTITTLEKDGIEQFRRSMAYRLRGHAETVTSNTKKAAQTGADSRRFAERTYAKHWEILRENKELRRRQIQKYYGELHRGRKIPDELLNKIETNFEKKFEMAKKADPSNSYEGQSQHDRMVHQFLEDHKGELNIDRGANAVLYVLRDMKEEDKIEKYNAFSELYHYNQEEETKKATEQGKTPEQQKAEKEKKAAYLKEANKELLDYITSFPLKKLEFKEITELAPHFEEINHYMQIMGDLQHLPGKLYQLGIVDDAGYLDIQSRMELVIGYTWLFHNSISAHSTVLDALVDSEDMLAVNAAEEMMDEDMEVPEGLEGELMRDKASFEDTVSTANANIELIQYMKAHSNLASAAQTSAYMPGGSIETALLSCRETATQKLNKLKAEMG